MLGDNFFHGHIFHLELKKLFNQESNFIFTQRVKNSSQFGVLRKKSNKTFFIEKPKNSKNEEAITGLYILDEDIFKFAHKLKKSKRQETEITDILKLYSKKNKLNIFNIGQGTFWVDGGTFKNLSMISDFINILEKRNIKKIGLL